MVLYGSIHDGAYNIKHYKPTSSEDVDPNAAIVDPKVEAQYLFVAILL